MYGFIYNTLRTLVVENFGEATWNEICEDADCILMKDHIVDRHYYDETILTRVGAVAEKKLGLPLEKILEMFGGLFFDVCKRSGHSSMLRTLGHNLYGFLINLDSLHDHLSFTYTEMQAPSFLCEKTRSGLTLHYFSQRPGLSAIVIGIVQAVAKDFYSLDITMEMVKYEQTAERLAHHYTYHIEVKDTSKDECYIERLTGEKICHPPTLSSVNDDQEMTFEPTPLILTHANPVTSPTSGTCPFTGGRSQSTGQMVPELELHLASDNSTDSASSLSATNLTTSVSDYERLREQLSLSGISAGNNGAMPYPLLPRISFSRMQSRRGSAVPPDAVEWPITQTLFQNCFPFHILFDRELKIRFMGVSLHRLFPKAVVNEEKLTTFFELTRPALALTYQNIRGSIHNIFIIRTKKSSKGGAASESLQFRGQMLPTSSREGALILFLGSPRVNTIEDLESQGLYLSDIPVHDVTRDLLLLNRHFRVEMGIAKELEETRRDLQVEKARTEEEKRRADDLLHAMLPRSVANELKKGLVASAKDYPEVTILFSDIKGFTNICNQCNPMQVVGMLNTLYTRFDSQLEQNAVYKVETIGDAYMVAAGLLDTSTDHAAAVTNMAFAMREAAEKVMDPVEYLPLQIRIGIHSGGVVAGVVGLKMPRYCLFGDTVNTASRMESHGEPGRVHISAATYELLVKNHKKLYTFYNRGKIEVKGLGLKQTYFVEPPSKDGVNSDVIEPKSDSPTGSTLGVDNEVFFRSPSFVKFSKCTIVNAPSASQLQQQPFDETCELENVPSSPGIQMIKPRTKSSVTMEDDASINKVVPIQTKNSKTEIQISTPEETISSRPSSANKRDEQNGKCGSHASLFISNGNSNNGNTDSAAVELDTSRNSKRRQKCVIS